MAGGWRFASGVRNNCGNPADRAGSCEIIGSAASTVEECTRNADRRDHLHFHWRCWRAEAAAVQSYLGNAFPILTAADAAAANGAETNDCGFPRRHGTRVHREWSE